MRPTGLLGIAVCLLFTTCEDKEKASIENCMTTSMKKTVLYADGVTKTREDTFTYNAQNKLTRWFATDYDLSTLELLFSYNSSGDLISFSADDYYAEEDETYFSQATVTYLTDTTRILVSDDYGTSRIDFVLQNGKPVELNEFVDGYNYFRSEYVWNGYNLVSAKRYSEYNSDLAKTVIHPVANSLVDFLKRARKFRLLKKPDGLKLTEWVLIASESYEYGESKNGMFGAPIFYFIQSPIFVSEHNPINMEVVMSGVVFTQNDITYTLNSSGYPSKMVVKHPGGQTTTNYSYQCR